MKAKKWLIGWKKILVAVSAAIVVVLIGGFIWLRVSVYQPTATAEATAGAADKSQDYYVFKAEGNSKASLIFYPGALVAPASYSVWAKAVAKAGYTVYLLKLPLDLAVFAPNKAQEIIDADPTETFVVGGHSLGGVMASRYAKQHSDQLKGVFFLASYPDEKGSLAATDLAVLSLVGSVDGVLNWDNYEAAKSFLPQTTSYQTITGGNHAGFGSYGKQKGDHDAQITTAEQQKQVSQRLIAWLQENIPAN